MNADHTAIAQHCLNAAYDGSLSFPAIVGKLIVAGFEGYAVDYRRNSQTYFHPDVDPIDLALPHAEQPIAADFAPNAVEALVRWAQADDPGYTYAAFCEQVMAAGCAGYLVSFTGRRVVYYGRTAETHIELFPQ